MVYDPEVIRTAYDTLAAKEDRAEKEPSLRTEIPREFIRKYIRPSDKVLDAGGGAGVNAIMMAGLSQSVTLVDISPGILELAIDNIRQAGASDRIEVLQGDITDLSRFGDNTFSLVVCVGDSVSYVLEQGPQALRELVRVAQPGAILVIGCDSKTGFMRICLSDGLLDEAIEIERTGEAYCGMGPRTHVYTVDEMRGLLHCTGCEVLEIASTPTFADTIDAGMYSGDPQKWEALKALEMRACTRPELLGMGDHLLFIARKR
jgi:SAM-dependent methyltransferase